MTLVAGVDSSTQSCKVVIVETETGKVVRSGRAPHPDGTEVDPEAWWAALLVAIADAGGLRDVAAISICGQQHGMVVLGHDGRVIRKALLWNDTRSASGGRSKIWCVMPSGDALPGVLTRASGVVDVTPTRLPGTP